MRVLIQAEAGSCAKRSYDERTLEYRGTTYVARPYPYPYGFIIGTWAADGDCVDCYLITDTAVEAGTLVDCEAIGLLHQEEDGQADHKVLAAMPDAGTSVSPALVRALRQFLTAVFAAYPGINVRVGPLLPREAAEAHIRQAVRP